MPIDINWLILSSSIIDGSIGSLDDMSGTRVGLGTRLSTSRQSESNMADIAVEETPTSQTQEDERPSRLTRFPQTRIRNMMKLDPDLHLASQESVLLITKAAVSYCVVVDIEESRGRSDS